MIRNLVPESFQPFGTILSEKRQSGGRVNHHCISLPVGSAQDYQAAAETWLKAESGITVISVSGDNETYEDYYLDKPVQLRPGIWFRLTAFQNPSSVQMAAILLPRLVQTERADSFQIKGQLKLDTIDTFSYQEKEQGFVLPGESYPFPKLVYVDRGAVHCVADGKDLLLEQGDLVLYGPNQWHMQYADVGMAPQMVSISFSLSGWDISPLTNRKFRSSQKTLAILQQMLREQERAEPFGEDMLLSLLRILLITLHRETQIPTQRLQAVNGVNSEHQMIGRAQRYISAHVREKLSVPVVAQKIQISPSYLTALFQKHLQISPGEYIRRIKLQESKQMIREGSMNFTEIAEALQYSTVHHFSRQFKDKFGITPSQYAKSVK